MTSNRRDILEFVGATATATMVASGLAGCVGVEAQEPDDMPAYTQWLALEDDGLEFVAVDWAALEGYVEDELAAVQPGAEEETVPPEYEADPMIAPVSEGLLEAYFFVGFDLAQYGLGRLLEVDAFESTVAELLLTDDALVATGEMDRDELDSQLTGEPALEFIQEFEQTDEIGEYDVYETVTTDDDADDNAAIGVADDALVVVPGEEITASSDDPTTALEATIAVGADDADRAVDDSEAVAWLVEAAGDGDVAVGQYGDRMDAGDDEGLVNLAFEAFDGLADADGVVSSLSVEDMETSTGDFAALIDDPDEDSLEEILGASADERSIDIEGDRVTATGTWTEPN
ncbi:hypothetical protein G6M89_03630 [Natronolimnobius sp. AArcel1]|uniref:hypothetical protein n=1 Tax=Natronolimnobius sp. AArcel1 TaxID=1679093 RepID=UPI0013EB8C6D|nr:hypothetical protein [Natronolimnobius sp. AArcel1]NGM68111.1 hypothetical protein [Natronolimnobius sp. AArcel1]